ncbi:MAG: type I-F CRISPR-associated helicase Cas3f [Polaromonas sp.]|nr:type I-F CRISPR-associated helicase Cas3f [Polaromonas sp.]
MHIVLVSACEDGHFSCGTQQAQKPVAVIPDWVSVASELAKASGKIHDIGKASVRFQKKLRDQADGADRVRHEWLSAKLIQAMRANGRDWEKAWKSVKTNEKDVTLGSRKFAGNDVCAVTSPLEAIDLLVMTHHKLLGTGGKSGERTLPTNSAHVREDVQDFKEEQYTPAGPIGDSIWNDYWTAENCLLQMGEGKTPSYWRGVSLFARTALIFADHTVSALNRINPATPANATTVYANTYRSALNQTGTLNQTLDWHLDNVGSRAAELVVKMHGMALPGLAKKSVESICQRAPEKYEWQNTAADALQTAVRSLPEEIKGQVPVLVFNIAGTGSGKTRMNVRAACVLRDGQSAPRLSIALNLRSLTLQTGAALRSQLKIGEDELATVIGDETVTKLFRKTQQGDFVDADENAPEPDFICSGEERALPEWLDPLFAQSSNKQRLIVSSPLLVSTIDYLIAAGEPGRQGHHVKAFLRVMSSDLVLDEIDGYDPMALVAVLRLVQVAAMAGRNVICSSATLAMPVAHAVAAAFRSGVAMREAMQGRACGFLCAQIDDILPPSVTLMTTETGAATQAFEAGYRQRLDAIRQALSARSPMRVAMLQKLNPLEVTTKDWLNAVTDGCSRLHAWQGWQFGESGIKVSFGLVRVANIRTAILLARHLSSSLPGDGLAVKIACYHSADFLISRFHKERRLDHLLSRGGGNAGIEADAEIQREAAHAAAKGCTSLMFIVVATPVEEIGRDHDFDWAVIEPSSAQSVVQTAGRVNRHRMQPVTLPNIAILQFNLRHCRNVENGKCEEKAFVYPGLELICDDGGTHDTHDMAELFVWNETDQVTIDARLRFDHEVSRLAACDDKSLELSLSKFFGAQDGRVKSLFDNENFACQLIGQAVYDASPLRSLSGQKREFFFTEIDERGPRFREKLSDGHPLELLKRSPSEQAGRDENDWLTSSFEAMLQMCEEFDVEPMLGTMLVISSYSQEMEVVLDESYGACTQ